MNNYKILYLSLFFLLSTGLLGQTSLQKVEYWFDLNHEQAVRQDLPPGTSVDFGALLDVSGLQPGLHTLAVRFRGDNQKWGAPLYRYFVYLPDRTPSLTTVTHMEYWFDGNYSSAEQLPLGEQQAVNVTELLDVASLNSGLHTLVVRFKDTRGKWSAPLTRYFIQPLSPPVKSAQRIAELEYWFDDNHAAAMHSTVAPTEVLFIDELLDVTALNDGLHFVNLRLRDENGKWNAPASWYFRKEVRDGSPMLHPITALQYWFDNDLSTAQTDELVSTEFLNLQTQLDVAGLGSGVHMASVRFRDEAGQWSPVLTVLFSKLPGESVPVQRHIVAMQHWFDNDFANAQTDPIEPTALFPFEENVDVSDLSTGVHMASVRFLDEAEQWSPAYTILFVKPDKEAAPEANDLVQLEYWLDGAQSSAVQLPLESSAVVRIDTAIDVSALGEGLHVFSHRVQDKRGQWSPAETRFFLIRENELILLDNQITAYRYWADGAVDKAHEVVLDVPLKSLVLDELVAIYDFPGGVHQASFQFRDALGNWSPAIGESYSKPVQPTVQIWANDSSICQNGTVQFFSDVFDADQIVWDFGDGTTSLDFNPEHRYGQAGVYAVSALVTHTDSLKSATDTLEGGIVVYPTHNIWLGGEDTLFYSSFENDIPGMYPAGWILKYNGTGSGNQKVVTSPVKNDLQAFQMEGQGGWASEFYRPVNSGADVLVLEAWVQCEKVLSGLAGSIGLGNFNVGTWGTRTSRLQFYNGKWQATYSGGVAYDLMDYVPGRWYHVKMVHRLSSRTYRVYVDGVLMGANVNGQMLYDFPMHPSVETIHVMLAAGNSGTTKMFFDDIVLKTQSDYEVCADALPFMLGTQALTADGFYTETFVNSFGCDSVVSLNLKVLPTNSNVSDVEICEGDSYPFGSNTFTETGTYYDTLQNVYGCDSILQLNLTVHPSYELPLSATICEGQVFDFAGEQLTESGTYTDSLLTALGCDSVIILQLNVLPVQETMLEATLCEGDSYLFGDRELSVAGEYRDTLRGTNGCDSIVVLSLAVLPVYETWVDTSVCTNDLSASDMALLMSDNLVRDTLVSQSGCDSIVVYNFTVNPSYSFNLDTTLCETELPLQLGTQTINSAGVYTEVFKTEAGCDSIIVLNVNVKDTSQVKETWHVCAPELPVAFGSLMLDESGVYTQVFTAQNGCDSTVTVNMVVHPDYFGESNLRIDDDEFPYAWEGLLCDTPGVYTQTYQSVYGCDSVLTLYLNIRDEVPPVAACQPIDVFLDEEGNYELSHDDLQLLSAGSWDDVTQTSDLSISAEPSVFDCSMAGWQDVVIHVADEAGNEASCSTRIRVYNFHMVDVHPVDDVFVQLEGGQCETRIKYPEFRSDGPCVSYEQIEGLGPDGVFPLGITHERWFAVNTSGWFEYIDFDVVVHTGNLPPTIDEHADVEVDEDLPGIIQLTGIGDGGDCLQQQVHVRASVDNDALVEIINLNYSDGDSVAELRFVPRADQSGVARVTVDVEDGQGAISTINFNLAVLPVNDPPVWVEHLPDAQMFAHDTLVISISKRSGRYVNDVDDDAHAFAVQFDGEQFPAWCEVIETPDSLSLIFRPVQADTGCYSLVLTAADAAGALAADTFQLCVEKLLVGISEIGNDLFEMKLYPNPTHGEVNIDLSEQCLNVEVVVMSIAGSEVFRKEYKSTESIRFDLSDQVSGVYVVRVRAGTWTGLTKLILDQR